MNIGHPDLNHIDPNVQIVFLPPNTTSLIQPMDQGVIATLKAFYRRITFAKGQLISKGLFGFFNSSINKQKNKRKYFCTSILAYKKRSNQKSSVNKIYQGQKNKQGK